MSATAEEPVGTQLLVGDADTELKAVLSAGLEAYNTAAIDAGEQRELSVKVVAEDGSVVAGLAGWTWGTCAGISLVWVREDARRQGWGGTSTSTSASSTQALSYSLRSPCTVHRIRGR